MALRSKESLEAFFAKSRERMAKKYARETKQKKEKTNKTALK